MDTNSFLAQDRATLLDLFRQFRADYDESDGDYSNRDELERKMEQGGSLNELDMYMLQVAVANTVENKEQYTHLIGLLEV